MKEKEKTFGGYLYSARSKGIILALLITICTFLLVFVSEAVVLLIYARWIFAVIFIVFIPGYAVAKTVSVFREIDWEEMISLSVGLSLSLVPLFALVSSYLFTEFQLIPILISLAGISTVFSLSFIILDYKKWKLGK